MPLPGGASRYAPLLYPGSHLQCAEFIRLRFLLLSQCAIGACRKQQGKHLARAVGRRMPVVILKAPKCNSRFIACIVAAEGRHCAKAGRRSRSGVSLAGNLAVAQDSHSG